MKHIILIVLAVFFIINESLGQESFKRNTVYGELLGVGGLASINFDYRLGKDPQGFGFRTGVGYFQWNNTAMVTIPVFGNYLLGKNGKYLDLGLGARFGYEKMVDREPPNQDLKFEEGFRLVGPILNVGYRYQPLEGGFNFRVGFSPYLSRLPYLSFGYTF